MCFLMEQDLPLLKTCLFVVLHIVLYCIVVILKNAPPASKKNTCFLFCFFSNVRPNNSAVSMSKYLQIQADSMNVT